MGNGRSSWFEHESLRKIIQPHSLEKELGREAAWTCV